MKKYNLNTLKKLGQGECAEIFELDDATVLKLAKEGWKREDLYEEYRSGKVIGDSAIGDFWPLWIGFVKAHPLDRCVPNAYNDIALTNVMF